MNQVENWKVSNMSAGYKTEFDRENGISSIIDTLGGSNITQVFVHSVTSLENITELTAIVTGLEKYPERSLLVARPNDIVCVLNSVNNHYLQFLSSLEIGPKNGNLIVASSEGSHKHSNVSLSDSLMNNYEALLTIKALIKKTKRIVLNPYVASPKEFKLAEILQKVLGRKVYIMGGNPKIVEIANYKHIVRKKAIELGIPVPEGDIVELKLRKDRSPIDLTPVEAAINRYIHKTGRVIVKGSYGFSGSSIMIVEGNPKSIQKALNTIALRTDNRMYIVEVMHDITTTPSVIMHIEPRNGSILCVSLTDQVLNEKLVHEGNTYPSTAKTVDGMLLSAKKLSQWLQAEGYSGLVGFDFGEYFNSETGRFEHFLAEINPRNTASVYPTSLMEHLNLKQAQKTGAYIEAFLSTNVKTNASSFAELNELYGHLFFKPGTGKGLFPYNIGCLEYRKFTLAVFGKSRNEVIEMYEDFKTLLAKE